TRRSSDLAGRNTPSGPRNACDFRRGHGRTGTEATPFQRRRTTVGCRHARVSSVPSVFTISQDVRCDDACVSASLQEFRTVNPALVDANAYPRANLVVWTTKLLDEL